MVAAHLGLMMMRRISVSLATVFLAAAVTAGCAAIGPGMSADGSAAQRIKDGVFTIQMASLHAFHDVDTERPPSDAPHDATPSDQPGAPVCRTVPPATGSRIGTRTMCMTGTEWQAKSLNDRDQLNDAESRALASTPYAPF